MLSQEWKAAHVVISLGCLALMACQHGRPEGHVGWSAEELALESSCQAGHREACRDLGGRLVQEKRPEKDLQRGLVLLELTCGQDDWKACGVLGDAYVDLAGPEGRRGRLTRAVEVLGRACAHGIAAACAREGDAILFNSIGDGTPAKQAFLAGCEQGDAGGCESFAMLELRSQQPDLAKAENGLARACELSRLDACYKLGSLLWRNAKRRGDAIRLWQNACDKNNERSCHQLFVFGAPLLSPSPDCRWVARLADRRCQVGDRDACAIHFACHLRDSEAEAAGALSALAESCSAGHPLSCLYWADASERTARGDATGIRLAYARACREGDLGRSRACVRSLLRDLATSSSSDESDKAVFKLTGYCYDNEPEACCQLGKMYEAGKVVASDASRAKQLRGKACELGLGECCPTPAVTTVPLGGDAR